VVVCGVPGVTDPDSDCVVVAGGFKSPDSCILFRSPVDIYKYLQKKTNPGILKKLQKFIGFDIN